MSWDKLWINAHLATFDRDDESYGLIKNGAIATRGDQIIWVGSMEELPGVPEQLAQSVYDIKGACVTPGFIDCHTHLVYAGDRANEFELRLQNVSYEAIARAGGGIQSTVTATRNASEEELFIQSLPRVESLLAEGVTTLEIKSGYGLDLATELKILRVAKRISETLPVTVVPTFLGAHTLPLEYKDRADAYINLICETMLPELATSGLAKTIDVFCESIGFNLEQTERVFVKAKELNFKIKCHAEQFSNLGATSLAVRYQALSVDHLEYLSEKDVIALAESSTVAVLLPGAFYYLREKQLPPIDLLRQYHVPIAIATDCNPGTSPVTSLLLMLNMACTLFRLTPEEALRGITQHAAAALNLAETHGTLRVGKIADLNIWNVDHPRKLAYYLGFNPLKLTIKAGQILTQSKCRVD